MKSTVKPRARKESLGRSHILERKTKQNRSGFISFEERRRDHVETRKNICHNHVKVLFNSLNSAPSTALVVHA